MWKFIQGLSEWKNKGDLVTAKRLLEETGLPQVKPYKEKSK